MARQRAPATPGERSPDDLARWQRRLFRHTSTRDGKRGVVRRWSVKIQHAGTQRTFTLQSTDRQAAAAEARAIHDLVRVHGWEAVRCAPVGSHSSGTPSPPSPAAAPAAASHLGKARLFLRKHPSQLPDLPAGEYITRIEHAGQSAYFPLGSANAEAAARNAARIYKVVIRRGWAVAARQFRRELTLALHWASNPLAWTYLTLDTWPPRESAQLPPLPTRARARLLVGIVESDPTLAPVLARCVGAHVGASCAMTCPTAHAAVRRFPRNPPALVLVNQQLSDAHGDECRERLRARLPGLSVLTYAVHEDSDQLFKATPGGAAGYLLKRTPPHLILDPISGLLTGGPLTEHLIAQHVRRYFQRLAESLPAVGAADLTSRLTPRELEVLGLISRGYLDKEIAEALRISTWTVHGHVKSIFAKLGVHTRTEAAVRYLQK